MPNPTVHAERFDDSEVEELRRQLAEERRLRQLMEQVSTAERNLSQQLVDSLPGVFYLFDQTGHFLRWNKNFEKVTGYSAEEVDKLHPTELFRGSERDYIAARIAQVFTTGEADAEARFYAKDGTSIPHYFTGKLIEIDGQICLIGMGIDNSARLLAEEERDRLFQLSSDMFCIAGFDGYFKQLNPAWEKTLGYSRTQLLAQPFSTLLHPEDVEGSQEVLASMRGGEPVLSFENRYRAADGTWHWLAWSSFPVPEKGLIYAVARDVTRQKVLEEHLRQVQKLDSIGRLAAGIAHDFNNLLTVQEAYLSIVLGDPRLPSGIADHLEEVAAATQRAATLTRQLLLFSRKQLLQPKSLQLDEVVGNLAKMLRRILGEDITLQLSASDTAPRVRGDVGMIEQVLMNLAVNARDAMPSGGRLHISVDRIERPVLAPHENPEARPGAFALLTVRDSGIGISSDIQDRVFEPFFTTKEVGKGTGLGLSTVYGIVKQHEGWIEMHSVVEQGTCFEIYLPLLDSASQPPRSAEVLTPALGGTETILLVEDEEPLRRIVQRILERRGYRVLAAENGQIAFDIWQREAEHVDLLLTDMVMPGGLSGRDVALRLRNERLDLRVIFSSGYTGELVADDKNTAFLQKPYLPKALEQLVREMLNGRFELGQVGKGPGDGSA